LKFKTILGKSYIFGNLFSHVVSTSVVTVHTRMYR